MAQITQSLVDEFRRTLAAGKQPPYTTNEFEQLLCAWERLKEKEKEHPLPGAQAVAEPTEALDAAVKALRELVDAHDVELLWSKGPDLWPAARAALAGVGELK